jgi:DNA repair protein SbcC/Rad50
MIVSLQLFNFQSHKKTQINLSPGVNVIVGLTDAGKTGIIRGLRWLAYNRPSGTEFRSHWGGETRVIGTFDNCTIERSRDKKNTYTIDGTELEAVKLDVPTEVAKALRFDEICFGFQFDTPFLLGATAGDVAQHFNRLAHLDIIDNANSNVQSWYRQIEQDIRSDECRLQELVAALSAFSDLDELEIKIVQLENLERQRTAKLNEQECLRNLLDKLTTTNTRLSVNNELLRCEVTVNTVSTHINSREDLRVRLNTLSKLINQLNTLDDELQQYETIVSVENQLTILEKLIMQRTTQTQQCKTLESAIYKFKTADTALQTVTSDLYHLQNTFDKNFPAICPLCEQPYKVNRRSK